MNFGKSRLERWDDAGKGRGGAAVIKPDLFPAHRLRCPGRGSAPAGEASSWGGGGSRLPSASRRSPAFPGPRIRRWDEFSRCSALGWGGGKNQPSETLRLLLFCAFWGKMSREKLGLRYEVILKNRNMGHSGDFSGCGSGTGVSHGNKMI